MGDFFLPYAIEPLFVWAGLADLSLFWHRTLTAIAEAFSR